MSIKKNLKDYIGILFYRHGLFCASHPFPLLCLVFLVSFICCYPLINLPPLGDSLEQFIQNDKTFDGLDAQSELYDNFKHSKLADKPPWYNRIPVAYIQQIIIKSSIKETIDDDSDLYLIDKYRTPLALLFEINDFIRNFHYHKKTITKSLNDICLHVDNLKKPIDYNSFNNNNNEQQSNLNQDNIVVNDDSSSYNPITANLPEFNCLYISPANYWSNSKLIFNNDDNIMNKLNQLPQNSNNYLLKIKNKKQNNKLRDILFGIKWSDLMQTYILDEQYQYKHLNEHEHLSSNNNNKKSINKTTMMTFSITIALKKYDKEFLSELEAHLYEKFQKNFNDIDLLLMSSSNRNTTQNISSNSDAFGVYANVAVGNYYIHLQYSSKSFWYYIPYISLYILLFLFIYISVYKIEFVKSKWGLAFAAVAQVIASLFMSVGICSFFGLTPTLSSSEIFPYLAIFIGFENIVVLTKSVVSTPADLDVRYRIALGLQKESWKITRNLTFELIILFIGILTMVPAIQEFCAFAYVGLLIDFFMQMIFFVTVLSIDIRRMELTDLNKIKQQKKHNKLINSCSMNDTQNSNNNKSVINKQDNYQNSGELNLLKIRKKVHTNKFQQSISTNENINVNDSNKIIKQNKKFKNVHLNSNNSLLTNKSLQIFFFWARTRIVQRAIMLLCLFWFILIFYKSMLVVELLRHDVNISKETVDALLPKHSFIHDIASFISKIKKRLYDSTTTATSRDDDNLTASSFTKINVNSLNTADESNINQNSLLSEQISIKNYLNKLNVYNSLFFNNQNWKRLSYFHWLDLFSYYNINLYNRYITILPQINLYLDIDKDQIKRERNLNEIERYTLNNENRDSLYLNSQSIPSSSSLPSSSSSSSSSSSTSTNLIQFALFELFLIVIFGIPVIILTLYLFTLLYKCLCSNKYEQWRRSWSTSNIKKQYFHIHKRSYNITTDPNHDEDEIDEEDNEDDDNDHHEINPYQINKNNNSSMNDDNLNINQAIDLTNNLIKISNDENDHHLYPIDLIAHNNNQHLLTSDLNDQIIIWNLNQHQQHYQHTQHRIYFNLNQQSTTTTNNDYNFKLNKTGSIWSICFLNETLFCVGFSNGLLQIYSFQQQNAPLCTLFTSTHLQQLQQIARNDETGEGITHAIKLNTNENTTKLTTNNYSILIAHLNGYLELIEIASSSSSSVAAAATANHFHYHRLHDDIEPYRMKSTQQVHAHQNAITNIAYEHDLIMSSSSKEDSIKIFKQANLMCIFTLKSSNNFTYNNHTSSINSLKISKYDSTIAASGTLNGLVCVWNLSNGICKFKINLNQNNKNLIEQERKTDYTASCLQSTAVVKIELNKNMIICLNQTQQLYMFNLLNGQYMSVFDLNRNFNQFMTATYMHLYCENYLITVTINTNNDNNSVQQFYANEMSSDDDDDGHDGLRDSFTLNKFSKNSILIWNLATLSNDNYLIQEEKVKENLFKKFEFSLNSMNKIKHLNILRLNNSKLCLIIIDSSNSIHSLEIEGFSK